MYLVWSWWALCTNKNKKCFFSIFSLTLLHPQAGVRGVCIPYEELTLPTAPLIFRVLDVGAPQTMTKGFAHYFLHDPHRFLSRPA